MEGWAPRVWLREIGEGGRFRLIYPPRRQELGCVGDILLAGKWVVICVIDIFFVRRCEDSFFFCKFAFEKNGHYE